jgi:hypothetical protein
MLHDRPGDDGRNDEEDTEHPQLRAEPPEDLGPGNPEPREP